LLKEELLSKKTSIQRLKRMLFGPSTEKTREVLGEASLHGSRGDRRRSLAARRGCLSGLRDRQGLPHEGPRRARAL
jgi:hypothetical protein